MRASALFVLALAGLAMAQKDCVLDIDGVEHTYSYCQELQPGLTGYYTFGPGPNGNITATCGLKAVSTGFAAWGLSPSGMMGPSSTIVVADLGTDVVVGGYVIKSKNAAEINAANGTLPLTSAHAGRTAAGELAATYEVEFPGVPNSILDTTDSLPQKYIYCLDGSVVDGQLAGHPNGKYGSGDITFNLKSVAPGPAASKSPIPMPSPMPKPDPVPPVSAGFAASAGFVAAAAAGAALML